MYNGQKGSTPSLFKSGKRPAVFQSKGFTLVELIVVMAIVAILFMVATPNYDSVMNNSRVDTARMSLATSLALARSEAVKRAETVQICKSAQAGGACTGDDDGSESWSSGWRVVSDGEVLQRSDSVDARVEVQYDCGDYLTYDDIGTRDSAVGVNECTFRIGITGDASTDKELAVALSGRVRL